MTNLTGKTAILDYLRQIYTVSCLGTADKYDPSTVQIPSSSGIYAFLNQANCRLYVGQSISLRQRFSQHIKSLNGSCHFNPQLQKDWSKFGASNFMCIFLESVSPIPELLDAKEDSWIGRMGTLDPLKGYNRTINGRAGSTTFSPCETISLKEWTAVRRLSDGFWCATVLCDQFNKRAENWTRLDFIQENIHLVQMPGSSPDKGIWCHPDLMIDLTTWISPKLFFAYMQYLRSIAGEDIVARAFTALGV